MNHVLVVALSTLREHARRKILLFFGVIVGLYAGVAIYLARARPDLVRLFSPDLSLDALTSLGVFGLIAIIATLVVSMGNIRPAIAQGDLDFVLSRPVTRAEAIAGRIAASIAVVVLTAGGCALGAQVISLASGAGWSRDLVSHWASQTFNLALLCVMTSLVSGWLKVPALAAVAGYFADQVVSSIGAFYPSVQEGTISGSLATLIRVGWFATPKYLPSSLVAGTGLIPQPQLSLGLTAWAFAWLAGLFALCLWRAGRVEAV